MKVICRIWRLSETRAAKNQPNISCYEMVNYKLLTEREGVLFESQAYFQLCLESGEFDLIQPMNDAAVCRPPAPCSCLHHDEEDEEEDVEEEESGEKDVEEDEEGEKPNHIAPERILGLKKISR